MSCPHSATSNESADTYSRGSGSFETMFEGSEFAWLFNQLYGSPEGTPPQESTPERQSSPEDAGTAFANSERSAQTEIRDSALDRSIKRGYSAELEETPFDQEYKRRRGDSYSIPKSTNSSHSREVSNRTGQGSAEVYNASEKTGNDEGDSNTMLRDFRLEPTFPKCVPGQAAICISARDQWRQCRQASRHVHCRSTWWVPNDSAPHGHDENISSATAH